MTFAIRPIQLPPSGTINVARSTFYGQSYARNGVDTVDGIGQNVMVRGDERDRHENQDFGFENQHGRHEPPARSYALVVFEEPTLFAETFEEFEASEAAAVGDPLTGKKDIARYGYGASAYEHAAFYGERHNVPLGSNLSLSL